MRVPERWLRAFVNPPITTEALADTLTMAGLEVEEAQSLAPAFSGVVVGRVLATAPHPDADRLRVCKVDVGHGGEPLQIVCGAPNVVPEMVVACATDGAALPGGFKIKRAKMRGVESQGMLCSAKELGIADDAEGLLDLPKELAAQLGTNVREALDLDACVLTLKLTPNRADCLSILGVAREVSALTEAPMNWPKPVTIAPGISDRLRVSIQAPDLCGRFSGRLIRGVNAKAATPPWMRSRLEQAGQRCISALVDISNYVMLEWGQPTHIFDADKIQGDLVVRWARDGESLTLLNEQTVTLDSSVGVIADDRGPESMAGIMGGDATAVSLDTQNIYVEAAFWWPDAIRGRARKYNFTTEAGHRFERGVDWTTTTDHVDVITALVQSICGGQAGPMDDQQLGAPSRAPVAMRVARCNRILGISVTAKTCMDVFERLGMKANCTGDTGQEVITVVPPSFRFDLEIEEDLIEEVARVVGFARIPAHPPVAPNVMTAPKESRRSAMQLRDKLVACDYMEAITYSFISPQQAASVSSVPPLALLNPMASHQSVMRPSLIPGLLDAVMVNVNRKASRVRLFEIGRTFHDAPDQAAGDWSVEGISQPQRIGCVAWGPVVDDQWGQASRAVDFFDLKADLAALASPLALSTRRLATPHPALHPGRSAEVLLSGKPVGMMGELHPKLAQELGIPGGVPVVAEVLLDPFLTLGMPRIAEVSKFPPVTRDLAVVVGVDVAAGAILSRINAIKSQSKQGGWITELKCFDEYRGKGLSEKEKSLAFRFILQSPETTLQDTEVDALINEILSLLQSEFSARLRG